MKKEDLIIGQKYTFFGISMFATTAKREGTFMGINENGNMIITMRKLTENGKYASIGTRLLPLSKDMFIVNGFTQDHGIFTDSEVPTEKGISFSANALYNICHKSQQDLTQFIMPFLSEEQKGQVVFYQMQGSKRVEDGEFLVPREEEIEECQ